AIENIQKIIAPALVGSDVSQQKRIDDLMIELDGAKNKSNLGANALLPVSMAVCRAGAAANGLPLWSYLSKLFEKLAENRSLPIVPKPSVLLIEGGKHGLGKLAFQEFMVIPEGDFGQAFSVAKKIYAALKKILKSKYGRLGIKMGVEGGFCPPITSVEEALEMIMMAIKQAGADGRVNIAIDAAASHFFKDGHYEVDGKMFSQNELADFYDSLVEKYPIISLEDPFDQNDIESWQDFSSKALIVGDDLTTTNSERIKMAHEKNLCTAVIIKPNQIGTVSETLAAASLAKKFGWKIIVSHRAGETNDDFIADLAVGIGADFIKSGAPSQKVRMTKYNRLIKIQGNIPCKT
ncbi:MAG: enolase C-terminal domain-like protein, partial [Patescibacteria group bacterium]